MKPAQVAERLSWMAVSAMAGNLVGSVVLNVGVGKAALMAGFGAIANGVSQLARYRLSVLPDPGQGLPGLPVVDRP